MSKPAKFSVGDRVRVTGKTTGVPHGTVLTVDKVHEGADPKWRRWYYTGEGFAYGIWQKFLELVEAAPEPEPAPIIAKLDRIIELLEQIHIKQVVAPYPVRYPSYPSYPYWGPNWWSGTTSVGAVTGTTVINNSTGPTSSSNAMASDG